MRTSHRFFFYNICLQKELFFGFNSDGEGFCASRNREVDAVDGNAVALVAVKEMRFGRDAGDEREIAGQLGFSVTGLMQLQVDCVLLHNEALYLLSTKQLQYLGIAQVISVIAENSSDDTNQQKQYHQVQHCRK